MIEIDGSYGEGGGQILRTSLACSIITGTPVKFYNIRANRPKPGLAAQHLTSVQAAAKICNAKVVGDALQSMQLTFEPGSIAGGSYTFEIGTAGATGLVFQTILYPLLFASKQSSVKFIGGTHVEWSPSFHYITKIFLKAVKTMGIQAGLELERPGFYPKGGGIVKGLIKNCAEIKPINLSQRGELKDFTLFTYTADLPVNIASREIKAFTENAGFLPRKAKISKNLGTANSPGNCIIAIIEHENSIAGFQSIAKRGKRAETIGKEVAADFRFFLDSDATVDEHLADQLILPACLAKGESNFITSKVTNHLITNADMVKKFFPNVTIEIDGDLGKKAKVQIVSKA